MRADDLPAHIRAQLPPTPKKARAKQKESPLEDDFRWQCKVYRLPIWSEQFHFAKDVGRMFRFDFAWPEFKVAFECEGLRVKWIDGNPVTISRHTSTKGFEDDMRKYGLAAELGWLVCRGTHGLIRKAESIALVQRVLVARGWPGAAGKSTGESSCRLF